MTDNQITDNPTPPGNKDNGNPVPAGFWIVCIIISAVFGYILFSRDSGSNSQNIVSQPEAVVNPPVKESKDDYIKSTSKIGRKGEAIYYKDFLKAPDRYKGQRLNITGKVLEIQESDGQSFIQIIITRDYDSVVVGYPGVVDVYKDDWVAIYGEGAGSVDGKNRMGASISWPAIKATYVVKRKGPPA